MVSRIPRIRDSKRASKVYIHLFREFFQRIIRDEEIPFSSRKKKKRKEKTISKNYISIINRFSRNERETYPVQKRGTSRMHHRCDVSPSLLQKTSGRSAISGKRVFGEGKGKGNIRKTRVVERLGNHGRPLNESAYTQPPLIDRFVYIPTRATDRTR